MEELLTRYPALKSCAGEIGKTAEILISGFKAGNKLMLCGNGGSCADCEHITGELMKGFLSRRPISPEKKAEMKKLNPDIGEDVLSKLQLAVPAIPLPSLTGLNSAFCNDVDPSLVYAQELMGLTVIALTGAKGGRLKEKADICICVPETETFKVQELHLPVYHYLCAEVEATIFG